WPCRLPATACVSETTGGGAFTKAQCTDAASGVQDRRKSAGCGANLQYLGPDATPGRRARTRAPGVRRNVSRRDAAADGGAGLERGHPRRERGRRGGGSLAVAAPARVVRRRRRGLVLRSHRRGIGRALVRRP